MKPTSAFLALVYFSLQICPPTGTRIKEGKQAIHAKCYTFFPLTKKIWLTFKENLVMKNMSCFLGTNFFDLSFAQLIFFQADFQLNFVCRS